MSVLTLREHRTDRLFWMIKAPEKLSTQWIHSVELEPWQETFLLTSRGTFLLEESKFKAFGAGVPDNGGKEFYVEDGWFIMKGFDREFDTIPIQVSCFSKQQVIINQQQYYLCSDANDGDFVTLKLEKASLFQYMFNLIMGEGGKTWVKQ